MSTNGQMTWERLVAIARRVGVKVIEAPSSHRGKLGSMGSVVGCVCHTTGTANTYRPADDYPDYNVVKEGRTGLVNTLSAYGIGRHEAIYVFSEFLCWHAGEWLYGGITDGNGHFLGVECAGAGDYTDFQRKVYPRLVAAILLDIGNGPEWAPRHLDGAMPRGRKPDAQNFGQEFLPGMNFSDSVRWLMANPAYININFGGDEDMAFDENARKQLDAIAVWVDWFGTPDDDPAVPGDESKPNSKGELVKRIRQTHQLAVNQGSALVALANLVAQQNGLSVDDVRRVVSEEIAKGLEVQVTVQPKS